MVKNKLFLLFVIISFVSLFLLLTSCEKLTASLDGIDKDSPTVKYVEAQTQNEESDDLTGGVIAEVEEQAEQDEESVTNTHIVKMTADGFSPDKLYIKAGDTVTWKNTRSGTINKAMIIGVRECSKVRSSFFNPGESFSWTFDKPVTCTIADGVMTTTESRIFVE